MTPAGDLSLWGASSIPALRILAANLSLWVTVLGAASLVTVCGRKKREVVDVRPQKGKGSLIMPLPETSPVGTSATSASQKPELTVSGKAASSSKNSSKKQATGPSGGIDDQPPLPTEPESTIPTTEGSMKVSTKKRARILTAATHIPKPNRNGYDDLNPEANKERIKQSKREVEQPSRPDAKSTNQHKHKKRQKGSGENMRTKEHTLGFDETPSIAGGGANPSKKEKTRTECTTEEQTAGIAFKSVKSGKSMKSVK